MRGWTYGLMMAIGTMGTPPPALADSVQTPSIELMVVNVARVSQQTLEAAQLETTRIYARIGVRLAWTIGPSSSQRLTISIVSSPVEGTKDPEGKLMGLATGTREGRGTLAYVFYQRIQKFAWRVEISVAQALGHVMAHEIGHLILPVNAHSATGIMRGDWDRLYMERVARGEETFTPEQIELIHNKLGSKPDRSHARE